MSASVTLKNVTVSYARHPAVHHVSGCFEAGSLTALAGPNGAGKSTLMKALVGILPAEGEIRIEGARPQDIAYLPQATAYERDFPLSVLELVCMGAWAKTGGDKAITSALRARALNALEEVGMAGAAGRNIAQLSAGQFQRVLFARVLMQEATLILLDEPFNALDAATTQHLLKVMARWHEQGRTVICILHDVTQIREFFPRCLLMARECVAWGDTPAVLQAYPGVDVRFLQEPAAASPPPVCEQAV